MRTLGPLPPFPPDLARRLDPPPPPPVHPDDGSDHHDESARNWRFLIYECLTVALTVGAYLAVFSRPR